MEFEDMETRLLQRTDLVIGGAASEEDVRAAESELGVDFPPALRRYLRRFGHLAFGGIELFGLGAAVPKHLRLVDETRWERDKAMVPLPHHLVPLFNDGFGNLYCIETEGVSRGAIVFWDHDLDPDQELTEHCASFEALIAELLAELEEIEELDERDKLDA